ncbi:unnamed protein product [Prorocentrum cordatum]|uniref:Uncharacterized protein n=1 Tax=Prorocentrum cordatum TaxID=2364126 RepID=A0ABN9SW10_9DINO|nr:unnamed protein product [Polarella glacialis]
MDAFSVSAFERVRGVLAVFALQLRFATLGLKSNRVRPGEACELAVCCQAYLARLHRRRFERVLWQHPLRGARGASLEALCRTRELALVAAALAGPGCVRPLCAASRAAEQSVGAVASELWDMFPAALYSVGGVRCGGGLLSSAERIGLGADASTETVASLAAPRAVCAAVPLAGKVYVAAGRGADGAALSSVESYDPRLNVWGELPHLRRARGWVAAAGVSGRLCVLGGEADDAITLDVAEQMDVSSHGGFASEVAAWAPLPALRCPRWAAAAAALRGCVYLAGGHHADGSVLGDVERLAPGASGWERLHPLRCPRAAFAMAALAGALYVVGGYGRQERGLRSLERLDPACGVWETLAAMAAPRWGLGAAGCGGSLYVVGGSARGPGDADAEVNVSVVTRFDPKLGAWSPAGRLRTARRCCGVVACR